MNTVLYGGAALAARRLHHALREAGVESRFWHCGSSLEAANDASYRCLRPAALDAGPIASWFVRGAALAGRLQRKWALKRALRGRPAGLEWFNPARTGLQAAYDPLVEGADVLHLHWIARFLDYPSFFDRIPRDFPIVWTLHDMHPLTGGCHYTCGCQAFLRRCGDCPQLGRPGPHDLSRDTFQIKEKALRGKNLHVVAPSRWMEDQARASRILGRARSFQTIPHGLDVAQFQPEEKAQAKRRLDLPPQSVVVGFGAHCVDIRRKGLRELWAAVSLVGARGNVSVLTFGRGGSGPTGAPANVRRLGFIEDPQEASTAYSASDIFVVPSLEEVFGLTGLEAMACGTPVVAFDTGGMPDYVRPMETGLLAAPGDPVDLARKIRWLIDRPDQRLRMGVEARRMVEREFRLQAQAARHIELYQRLGSQWKAASRRRRAA